jgi:MFS family permease
MPNQAQPVHLPVRYSYLFILALCGFVTSFGTHIVATNLPAYAQATGVGALMIGLLIGVYDFAELFAKPLAGLIADRRGMKLTLLVGLAIFILGSLLFLLLDARLLLLIRFLQGLGAAALSTVSITLVARYFSRQRGRAFGIYNAVKGLGYVIAPVLGGWVVHRAGFAMIFVLSAAVGGVALLFSLALPGERTADDTIDDDDDELSWRQYLQIFKEPRLLPVYGVIVINMFMVGVLFGFLPVYLYSIGYTPIQSGTLVSIATFSYLLIQPVAGYWADKVEIRLTVLLGLLLAALAMMMIPFSVGIGLLGIVIVAGLGIGAVWTNSDALVSTLAQPEALGATIGAAQSFKELGDMLGPLVVGLLTQLLGVQAGFVICGALALLFLFLLYRSPMKLNLPSAIQEQ